MTIRLFPKKIEVEIEDLHPWPLNPRKSFAEDGIEQLAQAIQEQGMLQLPLVRPRLTDEEDPHLAEPAQDGFEIICGERRWRAVKLLGMARIEVLVTEQLNDDGDALEASITENVQREDVHPLEEAEGLAQLRERGRSVEDIAASLGRPTSYVYRRLALASLCESGRAMLLEGRCTLAAAEQLARVQSLERQHEIVQSLGWATQDQQATAPLMRGYIMRDALALAEASWDLDDAELVPEAGACSSCPKRTGAQAVLFGEVEEDDRCTDRECFATKRDAWLARALEAKRAEGKKILDASTVEKLYPYTYYRPTPRELEEHGYVDLSAKAPTGKPWAKVLDGRKVAVHVAARPGVHGLVELVKVKDLRRVLERDPREGDPDLDAPPSSEPNGNGKASKGKPKPTREEIIAEAKASAYDTCIWDVVDAVEQGPLSILEASRFLAEDLVGAFHTANTQERLGLAGPAALDAWIASQKSAGPLLGVMLEIMLREHRGYDGMPRPNSKGPSWAQRVIEAAGVDWLAREQAAIAKALGEEPPAPEKVEAPAKGKRKAKRASADEAAHG